MFTNPNKITIPDEGNASPYPSEISVSGLNGPITRVAIGQVDTANRPRAGASRSAVRAGHK